MKKIITDEQKMEIVKLGAEHYDALIAYGGDMYRQGLINGAIWCAAGFGLYKIGSFVYKWYKEAKSTNSNEKES